MSPKVLYAMLIGALTALFFALIFGIPKLIRFIVEKLKDFNVKKTLRNSNQTNKKLQMNHFNKKTIIIASCVILGIAVIALTVTLLLTINSNAKTVDELNAKNEQLQVELDSTNQMLKTTESSLESKEKDRNVRKADSG